MSSVFACHPERSAGSAWPDVRFLTAFGMTHAWSTQSEPLPVLARSFDVGHAALAQLRMRSEAHTSELQSLMRISYAVFCLKKTKDEEENTTGRENGRTQ